MIFLGCFIAALWVLILLRVMTAPRLRFRQDETALILAVIFLTGGYILLVSACMLATLFAA